MDRLDVRILRSLVQGEGRETLLFDPNFRRSFRFIARELDVDEGTVRNRFRKLHASGLIKDWLVIVNPRLTGGGEIAVWFDVTDVESKERIVEGLAFVDGVTMIAVSFGTWIGFIQRYRDEASLPRRLGLVRKIAGVDHLVVQRVPFPPCEIRLTEADWKLLAALRRHPRKSYEVLAREAGMSTKTVKLRIERMVQAGAVFVYPALDPRALEGWVMAVLHVGYLPEDKREVDQRIRAELDEYLWHVFHMRPFRPGDVQFCGFNLFLPTVATAEAIRRWAASLPKVVAARIDLLTDLVTVQEPLEREVPATAAPPPEELSRPSWPARDHDDEPD